MTGPVRLEGRRVVLEPLSSAHAPGLAALAEDDDTWTHMTSRPRGVEGMRAWIDARLAPRAGLASLPFAQVERATGALMGSTSLFDIDLEARSAEIGFTWLARAYRGAGYNAEAKLLLLRHAFGALGLARVQLMTNARNERSQRAMARIGATREGLLRNHRRNLDGTLRDTVVFSVVDREWPDVEVRLSRLVDEVGEGPSKKP